MKLGVLIFALALICQTYQILGLCRCNNTARSCLDYFKRGHKTNGYYHIQNYGASGISQTVYCDMTSEPGCAWTLVESFALRKRSMPAFSTQSFNINAPVRPTTPNWNLYRMSLPQMSHLKAQSTHWRVTCDFPRIKGADLYRDYAVARFKDFDVLSFKGRNECKKMEYINIRGHECAECTAGWYAGHDALHVDSPSTGCQFTPKAGATFTEDNFGLYLYINKKFRCSSSPDATTNYWFGACF